MARTPKPHLVNVRLTDLDIRRLRMAQALSEDATFSDVLRDALRTGLSARLKAMASEEAAADHPAEQA